MPTDPTQDAAIPIGAKFALLTLESNRVANDLPPVTRITPSLTVLRNLPLQLPNHWNEWLGTLVADALTNEGLFIVASAPSKRLEVLDAEHKKLNDIVHRFYWSLLLQVPFLTHDQGLMILGSRTEDQYRVHSCQKYDQLVRVPWAPRPAIDELALRSSGVVSEAIGLQLAQRTFPRMFRGNTVFYDAVRCADLGPRTLGFVRTIEAITAPPIGRARRAFIGRAALFVGAGMEQELGEMYDIRSAVVHMHEPWRQLEGNGERERRLIVLKRCIQSEALARCCLVTVSVRHELHPFVEDLATLEAFWRLPFEKRRAIWGGAIDLNLPVAQVRDDRVEDRTLGL